jgi:hypothetical protein
MHRLDPYIRDLQDSVSEYDRLIPYMPSEYQGHARFMRDWDVRLLGEYQRARFHA